MRPIPLALFAAALLTSTLFAPAGHAQLRPDQTLRAGEMLQGRFVQERHLSGMTKPIRSEGRFLLAPGKGLIWRAEKPFAVIAAITPAGLMQRVGDGEPMRLAAGKLPFLSRFYDMLSRALAGDWGALDHDFSVEKRGTPEAWTIVLTPLKPDQLAAAQIASITATGSTYVDTVEIRRPNGDWEHLDFLDQVRGPEAISPDDAKVLESVSR